MADDNAATTQQNDFQPLSALAETMYPEMVETPDDAGGEQPDDQGDGSESPDGDGSGEGGEQPGGDGAAAAGDESPDGNESPDNAGGEDGEASEDDENAIQTLAELAEHLEADPEYLLSLKVATKVNGKEGEVSIADAIATHQKVEAADAYLSEAKEKSKTIESQAQTTLEQAQTAANDWGAKVQALDKIFTDIDADIQRDEDNLKKLRDEDPAEFSARKEEIRDRRAKLERQKQEAREQLGTVSNELTDQQKKQLQAHAKKEKEKLIENIPEFGDKTKGPELLKRAAEYLVERGFTKEELSHLYDHRWLATAYDAMLFRETKSKSQAAKKKVAKIPKVMKPGSSSSKESKTNGADKDDPVSILYGG